MRFILIAVLATVCAAQSIPLDWVGAMNRVRAESMHGHLAFLSSDLLEGRNTPSRGLNIAAEYIAAQFRRDGLEPGGNNGYFHDTDWAVARPDTHDFSCRIRVGDQSFALSPAEAVPLLLQGVDFNRIPVLVVKDLAAIDAKDLTGRVVLLPASPSGDQTGDPAMAAASLRSTIEKLDASKPALVIFADPSGAMLGLAMRRSMPHPANEKGKPPRIAGLFLRHEQAVRLAGTSTDVEISLHASAAREMPFKMRNVAGILRGSDPKLRETYVFVTAHYDHIGMLPPGPGDRIFNGANDDGSGTVALLDLAEAFSKLPQRPMRSIVFMTVAGEEYGLLGSRAYVNAPSIPLAQTVADLNLEVLGRPDGALGMHLGKVTVTGFGFTSMGPLLAKIGKQAGVEFYRHETMSDPFFNASDNLSFAEKGIPAHTLSNGFEYKEYHRVGDEIEKIDFGNMEKIVRAIGLGVLEIANSAEAPRWDSNNPKTERFRGAQFKPSN